MSKPIVVGYDSTDCGRAALGFACDLARELEAKVIVAYGFQPYQGAGEIGTQRELMRDRGREIVDEGVARATEAGVKAEAALVPERPAAALVSVAGEQGASMIVVGTYGDSPLKGAILGSTPHKLVQISEVPIVITPVPDDEKDG